MYKAHIFQTWSANPWDYVAGTLDAEDRRKIEDALDQSAAMRKEMRLIRAYHSVIERYPQERADHILTIRHFDFDTAYTQDDAP